MKAQTLKRYSLIKEYPGSPVLGTVVTQNQTHHYGYIDQNVGRVINRNDVENQSEYWEEVVEKDYEILSFKNISQPGTPLFTRRSDNKFSTSHTGNNGMYTEENMLLLGKHIVINSIKRLSDGQVFAIGNKTIGGEIANFKLEDNELLIELRVGKYNLLPACLEKLEDKYFSTKKAAEDFVIYNKPCLSLREVINTIGTNKYDFQLRELAKSKL